MCRNKIKVSENFKIPRRNKDKIITRLYPTRFVTAYEIDWQAKKMFVKEIHA